MRLKTIFTVLLLLCGELWLNAQTRYASGVNIYRQGTPPDQSSGIVPVPGDLWEDMSQSPPVLEICRSMNPYVWVTLPCTMNSAGAIQCQALGTNQGITLSPSGTGSTVVNALVASSPTINGTPTGTGIPTITQKKGSDAGNYSTTGLTWADVDATNLAFTVTIPTGWKLVCQAVASVMSSVVSGGARLRIWDATALAAVGSSASVNAPVANIFFSDDTIVGVVAGDGASHLIKLQFAADAAATVTSIQNIAGFDPVMLFTLTPSN